MDTLAQLRAGKLAGIRRLDLSCNLSEFPREIFDLADSLEVLNLSGNALQTLPDDLGRLNRLRVLFCSDNKFTSLPASIGQCRQLDILGFKANRIREVPAEALPTSLRWLILTDNCIEELPYALGQCLDLQKLMLAGNQLQQLPEALAACKKLELIRIAANRLTVLPAWLLALPRLTWLAYAGNPLGGQEQGVSSRVEIAASTRRIPWASLELEEKLGEGASGEIHRAFWTDASQPKRQVAVKLFKGHVTSDGLPLDEMAACIATGTHPNLIGIEGLIEDQPEGRKGLVMRLIDPGYAALAGPPSLSSCTRDCYADDLRLSLPESLSMAHGIASAAAHVHRQSVTHGDLYAHNVLWDGQGSCLLGDFGAASFYPPNEQQATALQRIEVRAFGILLAELLERCDDTSDESMAPALALQRACVQASVLLRPTFVQICLALAELCAALE